MLRKITILTMILFLLFPQTNIWANEEGSSELVESAKSAMLLEVDTGTILYDKDPHKRLPPASMTKLMSMLLIMEELDKGSITLEETIQVSEYAASMGGSQIYLEPFEEMTVEDLLKAVAVASANDATVALAERISVTEQAFIDRMNERASELGLENTNFVNSTGLPAENQYSSAHDMARIAQELLHHEEITDYTKIYEDYLRQDTDDEFWLVNTNRLVKFYQGVDGLKTGYTSEAKYCLTATAKRGDMRVVSVVMGAETPQKRNADITSMLDYAYGHYELHQLHAKDDELYHWQHIKADNDYLVAAPKQNISMLLEKGENISDYRTEVSVDSSDEWPLAKGDEVGKIEIYKEEQLVKDYPLTIKEEIKDASVWTLWKRMMNQLHHRDVMSNLN
ncbi:D-alanyl-D-alanine carboxypeptidase family protein [Alkalibacillus haloalkaliphilus]|uniref:serine-type D-Ala-D-Ala carboxypeptidase n=1 Tax=Alkalibacillus haloalkaliphilus TaxID=94136 RepID=A0A511W2D1_9BACI|nr:D-alanyl-D-alanine carboxypeptidase family protein [Alkalibacillus haloalkaliphilus]GEN45210.1 D-alanyl-D-alanine carboxypeptidase DacF [Alkalibacillus haloalkaliphilus]